MSTTPSQNDILSPVQLPITVPPNVIPPQVLPVGNGYLGSNIPNTEPAPLPEETMEELLQVSSLGMSRYAPYVKVFASTVYNPDALIQSKGWDEINGMKTLAAYAAPLNLKRYGVLYLGTELRAAIQDPKNSEYDKAQEIRDFCEYVVNNISNPTTGASQTFRSLIWNLTNMFHSGFHVSTFTWKVFDSGKHKGKMGILSYTPRTEKEVGFWVDPFDLGLRSISIWNITTGKINVPLDRVIYGVYNPVDGLPFGWGDARDCYKHSIFLGETFRYWMIAVERGSIPFIHASTTNSSVKYNAALRELLDNVRQGGNLVTSKLDAVEAKQLLHPQAIEIYTKTTEANKREIAELILGNTLTTQQGSSGSYGQYKAHENTQEFVFANAKQTVKDAVYPLFRWIVRYNYGREYEHLTPELYLGDLNAQMRQQIATLAQTYATFGMFTENDDREIRKQIGLPMLEEEFVPHPVAQNAKQDTNQ